MTDLRPKIKVCGITRLEDALALDALGVDYLGFNFSPDSKRFVPPARAGAIIARLRHAKPVGVFVNHTPEQIATISAETGIQMVQLHGEEGWDTIEKILLPVIKAVPSDQLQDWGGLREEWDTRENVPDFFLADTRVGGAFGGTGAVFDWTLLGGKIPPLPRPYFLAGGLGPANVAEAVRIARPFAVDLNSKVESGPGVKDAGLVERCMEILKSD